MYELEGLVKAFLWMGILMFIASMFGAIVGAISGWILDFTIIGEQIRGFLNGAGIQGTTAMLGATVGFIGGLIASTTRVSFGNYYETNRARYD